MGDDAGQAPLSGDAFKRKLNARPPEVWLPFAAHGLLVGWWLYSLADARRWDSSPEQSLFTLGLHSILYWVGITAMVATAVIGLRIVREGSVERWRWPLLLPTLTLVSVQMLLFSRGTNWVAVASDAGSQLGASMFTLAAMAISLVAGIASVGYGFAACALSLSGWVLAVSAGRDTAGAAASARLAPAVASLVGTALIALVGPIVDVALVLVLGVFGSVALLMGRSAGTNPTAVRDLLTAGICTAGACVLAGLCHANRVLSRATGTAGDASDGVRQLGESIERANWAQNAAWIAAVGFLVATLIAVYVRRSVLLAALKLSVSLLLGCVLCFVMPWAGARFQLGKAVTSLTRASQEATPSDVKLPKAPHGSRSQASVGSPWSLGIDTVAPRPGAPPRSARALSAADCAAIAKELPGSAFGRTAVAIDQDVPYERAYCMLSAWAAGVRANEAVDLSALFLGEAVAERPLPEVFGEVSLPAVAVRALVDSRGWERLDVNYAHIDASGQCIVNVDSSGVGPARAASQLSEEPSRYQWAKSVAVTAHPQARWSAVFALVANLTVRVVTLGPPNTKAEQWEPPTPADAPDTNAQDAEDD